MIRILPTRQYRLLLCVGVWLLCAVFAFFAGAVILERPTVLAVGKLVLLVVILVWIYRQLTRIGEVLLSVTELRVLQPGYSVRIPLAHVEQVQQRAQTLVQSQSGLQTRVHRVILDVRLKNGAVKPVVTSVFSAADAQWIEHLLHIAQTQDPKAISAYLTTRTQSLHSLGYVWVGISFLVMSLVVSVVTHV